MKIDLNVDVGEGLASTDLALLEIASSGNIACGGHAGDAGTMAKTLEACLEAGIRIGAHPSYPDRANFGRASVLFLVAQLIVSLRGQVSELIRISGEVGTKISYLKPHGALYNDATKEADPSLAVIQTCRYFGLSVMGMEGSLLEQTARGVVPFIREGFADRHYLPDGSLVSRSHPDALILDPGEAADQALSLAPHVDSICVHSDTPGAVEIAKAVRRRLEQAGWPIGN